ncbi:MAG TPA: hypothetical protein VJB57_19100 [Dehalococcoidia bacterium]|nr:hypothetical protein [Dehalococcoidia bacterium]
MALTRVKYVEVAGQGSEAQIQSVLDEMSREGFELFQIVPNIDDRRGNPGVTAGMYLFFRQAAPGSAHDGKLAA